MQKRSDSVSPFDPIYFRLAALASGQRSKVVGITSPGRGEGSTTFAVGIARSAVGVGAGPVLIIDAAARGRRVANLLRVKTEPLRFLAQSPSPAEGSLASHIVASERFGVDVLTLDASQVASTDVAGWQHALGELRSRYPFVIVDAADLKSPVPMAWRSRVDKLALVVDTTRATVESLTRLRKEIAGSQIQIDGFALNKRRYYVPKFLYRFMY